MKNKWQLVLYVGLVLLLTSSVVGCLQPSVSELPVIAKFSANPSEIVAGESVTLFWSVNEATTVTIDQDVGTIPETGWQSVLPITATTYTLRAINDIGSVTKAIVITVYPPPPPPPPPLPAKFFITTLSISPKEVEVGGTVGISCNVLNSGETSGTHTIIIKIDGEIVQIRDINLDAKENQVVSLTRATKTVGIHTVEINGLERTFTTVWGQIIEDLAYIKVLAGSYTDDADPEPEGISISIWYYDSKSEHISFRNVPVEVRIRLYGYPKGLYSLPMFNEDPERVYQKETTIYNSSANIRLSFEDTMVDQKYYKYGDVKVRIQIPNGDGFNGTMEHFVRLYVE